MEPSVEPKKDTTSFFLGAEVGQGTQDRDSERLIHQVLAAGACLHLTLWQAPLTHVAPTPITALWTHLLLGS